MANSIRKERKKKKNAATNAAWGASPPGSDGGLRAEPSIGGILQLGEGLRVIPSG